MANDAMTGPSGGLASRPTYNWPLMDAYRAFPFADAHTFAPCFTSGPSNSPVFSGHHVLKPSREAIRP